MELPVGFDLLLKDVVLNLNYALRGAPEEG